MSVHPDYRGLGIARKFHDARKAMCKRLGLKGQVVWRHDARVCRAQARHETRPLCARRDCRPAV